LRLGRTSGSSGSDSRAPKVGIAKF
jgi:hypothetical protein